MLDINEISKNINDIIEYYFAEYHRDKCYIGLIFQQGKRDMVQINVPAHDLPILLQAKPSINNDPDSGKNRPEVKGYSEEIKDYLIKKIKNNKPWILGTLTANIDPDKIKIFKLARNLCFVVIPRGIKLDITDGQHRKSAIHELIEISQGEIIGNSDFPITLVLEKDFNQCQSDFRNMAQTRQLDKSLLLSFGEFEGKVGITKKMIELVSMFEQKTEKIKSSPSTKYKLIYTSNYITRLVSLSFTGELNHSMEDYNVNDTSILLAKTLNDFFSECIYTKNIAKAPIENLSVEIIDEFKNTCILGRLLYLAYDRNDCSFIQERIHQIATIDWLKNSPLWNGNIILTNFNENTNNKSYKILNNQSAINLGINTIKNKLNWLD
jgi:DNA sulfur modification protein DndB